MPDLPFHDDLSERWIISNPQLKDLHLFLAGCVAGDIIYRLVHLVRFVASRYRCPHTDYAIRFRNYDDNVGDGDLHAPVAITGSPIIEADVEDKCVLFRCVQRIIMLQGPQEKRPLRK
jgi:hypothetical protein